MSPRDQRARMEVWDYLGVVRRNLLIVLGVTVLVTGSALALSTLQDPTYTSKGRLLVQQGASVFGTQERVASSDFVQTEIQFLKSDGVRDLVRERLGTAPEVEAAQVGTTTVVEVAAEGATASRAKETADAYMNGYLSYRRQVAVDAIAVTSRQVQAAIEDLQRQIDALSTQLRTVTCPPTGACAERTAIEQDRDARVEEQVPFRQRLSQLNIDASSINVGSVVVPAKAPSDPTSPNPVRNGAVALVLGALLGVGLALLHEFRNDSVRDSEDLERSTPDTTVLAVIPHGAEATDAPTSNVITISDATSPSAEAYRSLRTSIRFLAVDRDVRSIQVTSAGDAEGKTTTAANLAVVLARAGELVIMVDCDLRRPRLHEYFGVPNDVGLTSILLGEANPADALVHVTEDRRLWLLPAGPRPPNPSDLLSSARATELLGKLQRQASMVVIDCPPVLTVSDAAIVSGKVDGTIVVVRAGVSSRKKVARAVDFLRQIGAPLLGTVLHATADDRAAQDGYWASGATHPVLPRRLPVALLEEQALRANHQWPAIDDKVRGEAALPAMSRREGASAPTSPQPASPRRKNRRR